MLHKDIFLFHNVSQSKVLVQLFNYKGLNCLSLTIDCFFDYKTIIFVLKRRHIPRRNIHRKR